MHALLLLGVLVAQAEEPVPGRPASVVAFESALARELPRLDDDAWKAREEASAALTKAAAEAETHPVAWRGAVRAAIRDSRSAEVRERLRELLDSRPTLIVTLRGPAHPRRDGVVIATVAVFNAGDAALPYVDHPNAAPGDAPRFGLAAMRPSAPHTFVDSASVPFVPVAGREDDWTGRRLEVGATIELPVSLSLAGWTIERRRALIALEYERKVAGKWEYYVWLHGGFRQVVVDECGAWLGDETWPQDALRVDVAPEVETRPYF